MAGLSKALPRLFPGTGREEMAGRARGVQAKGVVESVTRPHFPQHACDVELTAETRFDDTLAAVKHELGIAMCGDHVEGTFQLADTSAPSLLRRC